MPLGIDLFCGLGGWTDGLLAEGYDVIGFDIEQHVYGEHRYQAQLVVQDVLTLHGSQFRDADLIVASPPCQEYSYMAMPWSKAKAIAADYRSGKRQVKQLTALFDACFRIQHEACDAAGRHIPLVVENVRGAIPWVGRSRWNFGSYHLWGDVPALMPQTIAAHKVPGFRFDGSGGSFQTASVETTGRKNNGGSWFNIGSPGQKVVGQNPVSGRQIAEGRKGAGSGAEWFDHNLCQLSSKSPSRKMASAMIAKIPLRLSRHIARVYKASKPTQPADDSRAGHLSSITVSACSSHRASPSDTA
jgi:hypothetical protein